MTARTTAPAIPGLHAPSWIANPRIGAWVDEIAALTQPDRDPLVRRLAGGVRPPLRADGRRRHVHPPQPAEAPQQLPRPLRSRATWPASRTAPSSAASARQDAGPTNNWVDPTRDAAARCSGLFDGSHARPHHVRDPVLHGAARLAALAHRRRAHRLALRRGQHADHDPHGPRGARRAGRRRLRPLPALGRACRSRPARPTCPGPATRREVHRPLPRGARDLVVRLAATAATRCSARSASRCASPR